MLLRNLLFIPGNKPKMLAKATGLGADALIIDLEDSVPASEKDTTRELVGEWLREVTLQDTALIFVRVNALSTGLTELDLESTLCENVAGICLPKAECAGDVEKLASLLDVLERRRNLKVGSTRILALIESARGLMRSYEIAGACPRVVALAFGAEDYALDLGTQRSREGTELFFPRSMLAVAARAAEVGAIDGVYSEISDEEGMLREVRLAKQLGFEGKLVIHPKQIQVVNGGLLPSEEEVAYARKVIAAFEEAQKAGTGAISLDDKMIDMPVVKRAQKILDLARKYNVGSNR